MTTLTTGTRLLLPGDTFGPWRVKRGIAVLIESDGGPCVASTRLGNYSEWGEGATPDDAVADLVSSIGDFAASARKRYETLAPATREELDEAEIAVERGEG